MPSQIYLFFTGYELKEAKLEEVLSLPGILNVNDNFLELETRFKNETYVRRVEDTKHDEWVDAYQYLKQ